MRTWKVLNGTNVLLLVVALLLVVGRGRTVRREGVVNLGIPNPVHDLEAALESGDQRFVGLHEFGEFVPGGQDRPDLTSRFGVGFIVGTSDTATKREQEEAYDYALIYNALLIRHLKASGIIK